jgi:hypothetical protein
VFYEPMIAFPQFGENLMSEDDNFNGRILGFGPQYFFLSFFGERYGPAPLPFSCSPDYYLRQPSPLPLSQYPSVGILDSLSYLLPAGVSLTTSRKTKNQL